MEKASKLILFGLINHRATAWTILIILFLTFSQVSVKADETAVNEYAIQIENNIGENGIQPFSVPSEVYRYVGRTNYRVPKNWYYVYSSTLSVPIPIPGVSGQMYR